MSTAAAVEFDVRDEIRAAIKRGQSDPYKIAKRIASTLPKELLLEYAELRVFEIARGIMSDNRTSSFVEVNEDTGIRVFALDKWRDSLARVPGNGYVRYGDLTVEDCNALANERAEIANGWMKESKRYRALAKAMIAHKVKTAGQLPESVRMEIFQ